MPTPKASRWLAAALMLLVPALAAGKPMPKPVQLPKPQTEGGR